MTAQGPVLPYPDRRLPDLVAAHALHDPDAIAVRQWDTTLTYGELHESVTRLAAALRERGVGPEVLVGVCADREPAMITGLLGVLAAGGGYVPLDPALPPDRLRAIAFEASLSTIVGGEQAKELFPDVVPLDGWPVAMAQPCPASRDNVAYVMFTSGSTGRPKGVVIEHDSLTEFVTSLAAMAGLDTGTRCLALASIGFDASVIDILAPLAAGGTVLLASSADRADPVRLQRFCREHAITAAFLPPALLPVLDPAELESLRVVMTGSEAPGPEQVARWTSPQRRFLNLFGPTETTVLVTWFEATGHWERPLPIGEVAANHRLYVVDAENRLVAAGQPGELLAGGPGLARGYLGDADLTAARFIEDPFQPGSRVYRTGDLVSWQPDGTLAFLGRTDRQVKVRGQRIEIGEVEAALRGHPGIGHAAVAFHDGQLIAFVTGNVTPQEIREHCGRRLPSAAVPSRVLAVPELPLLSTGKIDLDRLIAALPDTGGEAVTAPATPLEETIAEIFADVLGGGSFGRDDDFFDCGGHSITAMRLVAELRPRLGRDVAIEDVLLGRTLRGIAERASTAAPLDPAPLKLGRSPALSPAQQRLWFLDRYSPEAATAYNVALAERLTGELDVPALEAALTAVTERQAVLRWRITDSSGRPTVVEDPVTSVALPVIDADEQAATAMLAVWAKEPFDLTRDRLWRARLIRLGPREHVLSFTLHHAVFDGWSQSLLYNDLAAAYAAAALGLPAQLPALPATYADYAHYRVERQRHRLEADVERWVSHLDGAPVVIDLPTDRPRPAELTFAAAQAALLLDEEATARVHQLARAQGATPPAVLLAAFALVLGRLTGQSELVIGTPMVDRRLAEFQEMVGFFIEIAPLRLRVGEAGFPEQIRAARDELLAALAHPEAPLERLVAELGLSGQVQRTPLVQVLFNMFNFTAPELKLAGLSTEPVTVPAPGAPFELTLYGIERAGRIRLEVVYNADLFGQPRMTGVLDAVAHVLATGEAPQQPVVQPTAAVPRAHRKALQRSASVPPATPTEHAVAGIWCEVLGLAEVGVTDSFFDVGGGSLAMAAVQQRLRELAGRDLRLVDLFGHPTVRTLARHLDGDDRDGIDEMLQRAARRGAARRDRGRGRTPSDTERQ